MKTLKNIYTYLLVWYYIILISLSLLFWRDE